MYLYYYKFIIKILRFSLAWEEGVKKRWNRTVPAKERGYWPQKMLAQNTKTLFIAALWKKAWDLRGEKWSSKMCTIGHMLEERVYIFPSLPIVARVIKFDTALELNMPKRYLPLTMQQALVSTLGVIFVFLLMRKGSSRFWSHWK